jgi:regulatory protein
MDRRWGKRPDPKQGGTRKVLGLRERALGLLARREHSRMELSRKLAPHAESREDLATLLDDLEEKKLVSDARYAEARSHALGRRYGSARIAQELRARGVGSGLVEASVEQAKRGDLALARTVWAKRFGRVPTDALERAKQMRFLMGRGFGMDVIRKVVSGDDEASQAEPLPGED